MAGPLVVLTCEHASAAVPEEGAVPRELLDTHWARDAGAADLARELGAALGAAPHLGACTRLWVDLNRSEHAAIVAVAGGVEIPGNALLPEAYEARLAAWHRPWRAAAARDVARAVAAGGCVHLSVHSFTPTWEGAPRAVEAGVLFDPARPREAALARALLGALADAGFVARENDPYLGTDDGHTTALRGVYPDELYAGIELELRDDLAVRPDARARVVAAVLQGLPTIPR